MGRATTELRQLLTPLDRTAGAEPLVPGPDRAADLARILHTARPVTAPARGAQPRRRILLTSAGIAAAAVAVAVGANLLVRPAAPALAATPVPLAFSRPADDRPATAVLDEIARRAASLPAEPRNGDHQHFLLSGWYLWSQIDGERVTSAVVPERRETWRAQDGSGRVVSRYEEPIFRSDAGRDAFQGVDTDETVEDFTRGELSAMWPDRAPSEPAALKPWLERGHPVENGPAEVITAITDLAREQVLDPAQRAAVLRVLARLPGLTYEGEAKDRAGRTGLGFSLMSDHSGLPTRHLVVVDPGTGRLLYSEEMLPTTAGKLNVSVPAVISYELYLKADYTARPR